VAFGVVQHLLVGPPTGPLHPGRQPIHQDCLAGCGHLRKPLAQVVDSGDERAVGLAEPEVGQRAEQQVEAVADLVLEILTIRLARRYDSPSRTTAAAASRRTSNESGGVPPCPGGRCGPRSARRWASQASTAAGSDERGQYDKGPDLLAGVSTLPMVWPRQRQSTRSITDTLNEPVGRDGCRAAGRRRGRCVRRRPASSSRTCSTARSSMQVTHRDGPDPGAMLRT